MKNRRSYNLYHLHSLEVGLVVDVAIELSLDELTNRIENESIVVAMASIHFGAHHTILSMLKSHIPHFLRHPISKYLLITTILLLFEVNIHEKICTGVIYTSTIPF